MSYFLTPIILVMDTCVLITLALLILFYINANVTRATAATERYGMILSLAGSIGIAIGYWTPLSGLYYFQTVLHIGLSLIAVSVLRGEGSLFLAQAQRKIDCSSATGHFHRRFGETK